MDDLLVSIPRTCSALGVGRSKVYQLIGEGRLEVQKIGRRTLIRIASIRRFAGDGSADGAEAA